VPRRLAILKVVHAAMLGLWLGALVMAGAAAAIIFPMVRDLDPSLPHYADYAGDHWRILAGQVANRLFRIGDWVQLVCALSAAATLAWACGIAPRPSQRAIMARWCGACVLAMLLVFTFAVLRPRMSANAEAYWDAARRGDDRAAQAYQSAFNADHPVASRTLALSAAALIAQIAVTAWSLVSRQHRVQASNG
jgi:hypothetical protein